MSTDGVPLLDRARAWLDDDPDPDTRTALEAIAAREAGLEILGLSLVTNLAAGMTGEPLNHEEVLEAGKAAATRMGDLLGRVIREL